jgi:hypothetical protein
VIGLYELLGNPTTQLIEPPGTLIGKRKKIGDITGQRKRLSNQKAGHK